MDKIEEILKHNHGDELRNRARIVDITDSITSIIENYLSHSLFGSILGYALHGVELIFKYQYFYKYYITHYNNPLGVSILMTHEFLRFFSPLLNASAIIPSYYLIASREYSIRKNL